jgi:HAD superfamily hydrolase (TIGR01549 family)
MKYQHYIWDLGGTLMDNYASSAKIFKETLAHFGIDETYDNVYAALKQSTDTAVAAFAKDIPNFKEIYQRNEAVSLEKPILFDGAIDVLRNLTENGAKHYMITHRGAQVMSILKEAGIDYFFTEVVTAEQGFPRKPKPDSTKYLLEKYKINPELAVMIGDRSIDIEAGNAAGISTVFFDKDADLSIATYSIHDLKDMVTLK